MVSNDRRPSPVYIGHGELLRVGGDFISHGCEFADLKSFYHESLEPLNTYKEYFSPASAGSLARISVRHRYDRSLSTPSHSVSHAILIFSKKRSV